jgi:DNA-binding winged helix-turn-helix (wHTH) protein
MRNNAETHFQFEDTVDGKPVEYILKRTARKENALVKNGVEMREIVGKELLQPQVLEVLAYFLRHPQQELERDAIIEEIWPNNTNGGGSLDHYVSTIRKLLQDQPADRKSYRLIVSIRDKGFKFLKPVEATGVETAISESNIYLDLEPYRRKWHHYHLTLDPIGKPAWFYKTVNFENSPPQEGHLKTEVTILPERGADPKHHKYQLEASLDGAHLILKTRRLHSRSDIGIELFPHTDPERFPSSLYSVRINQTWHERTVASSIGILTLTPRGNLSDEGRILSKTFAKDLQQEWETHTTANSQIVRLPLTTYAANKGHEPIRVWEKWNQGRFDDLLTQVRNGDTLHVVTTYFVNESGLRSKIEECLLRAVRIKMLVLDVTNQPLIDARFAARIDGFTPSKAAASSRQQVQLLRKLPGELKKSVGKCTGTIEIRISNLMPSGFVVHCSSWAVVAMMPARESYTKGFMLEIDPGTDLWTTINLDWKARWKKSETPKKGIHYE